MAGEATMISADPALRPVVATRNDQDQLGMLAVGQLIEARVESIGKDGSVRLLVAGTALDVDMPVELLRGSTIKLLVKKGSDGGLMLELKRPGSGQPSLQASTTHGLISTVGARAQGVLSALLDVRAALIAGNSSSSSMPRVKLADPGSLDQVVSPPSSNAEAGTPVAHIRHTASGLNANPSNLALLRSPDASPDAHELPGSSKALPDALVQILGTPDQQRTPPTTILGYFVPGPTGRLQIAVTHFDEGNNDTPSSNAEKTVKASFTFNSDVLGRVHVVMRQQGLAISIGLWAERPEIAAELLQERSELCDALGNEDIALEALEILIGAPPVSSSYSVKPVEGIVT